MDRIAHLRPRLDVRDLEVVLAIVAAGSTARAAAELHLTQSAVSRALAQAEDRIGVKLFTRGARGLSPTPACERLLEGAGPLLGQLVELERSVRAAAEERPRVVRVVCECYTAYRWLPSTLRALQSRQPRIEIKLVPEHTRDPAIALRDDEVDVALLTTASTRGLGAAVLEEPLFSDEIVFVVSSAHALAARRALTVKDLEAHPLVTTPTPEGEARWFAAEVFGRRGRLPKTPPKTKTMTFPLTEAVVDAARAGMGIAVMSEWIASTYLGGNDLVVKRLASGPLRRPWRIAWRRDVTDAARWIANVLEGLAPRVPAERPFRIA